MSKLTDQMRAELREKNRQAFLEPSVEKGVLYHGTRSNIKRFRPDPKKVAQLHSSAIFVTPAEDIANEFATKHQSDKTFSDFETPPSKHPKGANIMPVHVQAKNPFDAGKPEHYKALVEHLKKNPPPLIGKFTESANLDRFKEDLLKQALSFAHDAHTSAQIPQDNYNSIERREIQDAIKQMGHDSFYVHEMGTKNLGVFDPRKIKSAIGNRGTYDVNDPDITHATGGPIGMPEELRARYEAAKAQTAMRAELERQYNEEMKDKYTRDMVPFAQWLASKSKPHMAEGGGMYSAVDRALANLPRNKGTGQEFLNELMNRPGVKPTEIKERGLDTALAGMPKTDKAAVQKVASRNNPAPRMMQTIKLADPYSHPEFNRMLQEVQEMYTPVDDYGRPMKRLSEIEANDLAVKELGGHAKFNEKNYNVPGGMNYREMLLHLPKQKSEYSNYYGPHWDEPNVIAHMRMADRATPEGKKILHLEELQSDWHQDGRDKGYKGILPSNVKLIEEPNGYVYALGGKQWLNDPNPNKDKALKEALEGYESTYATQGVPNGPFKKNWEEYALKHLLNHAVENGYQHIAITPGAIQNKRWQRENDPKGMEAAYDKRIPNILNSLGKQFGVQVRHNGMFTPDQEGNLHPLHTFEITPEMSEHIAKHGFPAYKEGGAMRKPKPTVMNAQRVAYPGIYKDPRVIAAEAAQQVAPEHPSLKQLFGVTREDLYQMGKGRKGNLPGELPGQVDKPRGSSAAAQVMTSKNEQRLLDAMGEAEKHHALVQGMDPWYIMDPMFSHMVRLLGHEKATEEYNKMNHLMGMASPGSEVMTEIPRGTAAYMLQQQGRFPEFVKYAGVAESKRGKKFPADIRNVPGHAYHKTAQAKPMEQFLNTGEIQMKSPKVPMYIQASGVPATGFQTATPVGDAHWSRAVGLADTRNPQTRKGKEITPGASVSTPEMTMLAPWWRQQIAGKLGIESVPAQARAWGTFSPQTGVTTPIGAPKLELIARQIMETANRLGIAPEQARDMVLTGKTYAGKADGGSVTPETVPGANPLEGNQNTGAQVNFYPTPQNQSQYQQSSASPSQSQGMQSPLGDINMPSNPITDNTSTQQTPYTPDQTWANQPSRGLTNPLSKITSPLAAYAMGGGVDIKNVGVDEAPEMPIKAFVLPGATRKNPFPVGGIDFQPQMPGQQLTPQMPGQPPQGPQQGQQPQGQQPQGAPQGQPPSNILQMTPQGQAMNAMTPPAQAQGPTAMAKGGKVYALPGYRHEELHIAPSGDQMQYELMMAKHYIKKAK